MLIVHHSLFFSLQTIDEIVNVNELPWELLMHRRLPISSYV